MIKKVGVFIFAFAITSISVVVYLMTRQQFLSSTHQITNFEECVQAGHEVGESYPRQCFTPDGKHFVEETKQGSPPVSGQIAIDGEITCLPKIGRGAQTLECAIGLKGADGRYYGLKNLSSLDPENKFSIGGLKVTVFGTLNSEEIKGPDGNKYDVAGVINLDSIKEIAKSIDNGCIISGCSGQICSNKEVITTCEWKEEFACYKKARCERQKDGNCGWTITEEAQRCLDRTTPNQSDVINI